MALNTIVDNKENIKKFLEQMNRKGPSKYTPEGAALTPKVDQGSIKNEQKTERIQDVSPQLTRRIEPPNTPQVIPGTNDKLSIDEIKTIIHNSVTDVLGASKSPKANLSQSMHAPKGGLSVRKASAWNDGLLRGATHNNPKQPTETKLHTVATGNSNKKVRNKLDFTDAA